jgi:hypothetical protein
MVNGELVLLCDVFYLLVLGRLLACLSYLMILGGSRAFRYTLFALHVFL